MKKSNETHVKKTVSVVLLSLFRRKKLKILNELISLQWLSPSEIKNIQNKKFIKLINHCKENVPYYKKIEGFSRIKSLDDITQMSLLTKKIINENQEKLKTINIPAKHFIPNSTSGSTGESLKFYSYAKNYVNFGITIRDNIWTGWNLGERQAMLWGSHYDISRAQKLFNKIKNLFIHKNLFLSSYDMTERDMLEYQRRINRYKPQLITGYPNGLSVFAEFLGEKGLSIYKPKGIICSGETLYEYQRKKIESVFGCKVFNRYGCREVGNIAQECEMQEGLHINASHVIVEVLDENGNPCKPGELGEIVVTDLDNHAFPFIRYKIGDIGIPSDKKCSCGRGLPLLESVEGRTFDIIVGTNGNLVTGNFWTILLRTYVKGIRQFQVIQEEKDKLNFKLIVDSHFDNNEKIKLIKEVREKCGEDMKIEIDLVDRISLTKSGKLKFVISKCSPFVIN